MLHFQAVAAEEKVPPPCLSLCRENVLYSEGLGVLAAEVILLPGRRPTSLALFSIKGRYCCLSACCLHRNPKGANESSPSIIPLVNDSKQRCGVWVVGK